MRNTTKPKWSSLLWGTTMGMIFLYLGISWLIEVKAKGYFRISYFGASFDGAIISVYVFLLSGSVFLGYSLILAVKRFYESITQSDNG